MNKSKIPEYLIWVIYALASGACLVLMAVSLGMGIGYGIVPGVIAAVIIAVFAGLAVRGIYSLAQKESLQKFFFDKELLCVIAEGLLFVVMLVGMIVLRSGVSWDVAGSDVYMAAQVTENGISVAASHGGYKVYLYLLNVALFLFGNRTFAAVLLQLILLTGAAVSLYFGMRKLVGPGAALLVTAFLGFSPYMIDQTCGLNPFLLFLLCFGLALNCIGGIIDSMSATKHIIDQVVAVLCYVVSGVLIGFCCYLDVAGIVLLVILTGVICFGDDLRLRNDVYGDYPNRFAEILGSPTAVFVGIVLIAAFSFGKMHGRFTSLIAQLALYTPGAFQLPAAPGGNGIYVECVFVGALLMFGVFSFWCSKKLGSRVVWLFAALLQTLMLCFGINAVEYFDGLPVLYILGTILAGCGISDVLTRRPDKVEEVEAIPMAIIDMDAPRESAVNEAGSEAAAAINFIENPLPLPKKHTKKVMDYDYEVPEDDDFDIP